MHDALLTVLVPVRNGERLLPGWLASVERYADAVIALDDGSTDSTRVLLESHPLVTTVLTNPVRTSYHGWDDLGNRQRLVDAAGSSGSRWLLFLDADEQLDADDGAALRDFLVGDARPGFAYGFEVFRMVDDDEHYDPRGLWVFRLFAAADAVEPLGARRLHFVPVPGNIPRERWLFTSVRIQHSGSLTEEHRRARFDKYLEADPDNECQDEYENLLDDPQLVLTWEPRRRDVPVLVGTEGRYCDRLHQHRHLDGPAITAVVIAQDDVDVIGRSLDALESQEIDEPFEIIAVCSGSDGTSEFVREHYPEVRCVQLPHRAFPGEARNAGLWMAAGEFVTFPGSHVRLQPGSLRARLAAHDDGWDMVTAAVVNGNTTRAGWASYFLDHASQVPSRPTVEFEGVPGHASYITADVRRVGGFPEDVRAGEDTVVNRKLYLDGKRTLFCSEATFAHASPSTNVAQMVHHHFQRGRGLGRIIVSSNKRSTAQRVRSSLPLPARRLRFIASTLGQSEGDDELRRRYRRSRPYIALGAMAAGAGTIFELIAHRQPASKTHNHPAMTPAPRVASSLSRVPKGADRSAPLLVLSGRPGEAWTGILAAGSSSQAGQRLATFTRYAETVCAVRPALAPIVTSASVTAEYKGTYTIDMYQGAVESHLAAARRNDGLLLLQLQPGRATLSSLIERWSDVLTEPDVGVLVDLRDEVTLADQRGELDAVIDQILDVGGPDTVIVVRGATTERSEVIIVDDFLDLRDAGTLYPHDALRSVVRPSALVYH